MARYLCYELAQQPPSLFDNGMMRPANKAALASYLKSKVTIVTHLPDGAQYVLDGGHLIHVVVWPENATYQDIIDAVVQYVMRHYGPGTCVLFDGYGSECICTKASEQVRRAALGMSSDIISFMRDSCKLP